MALPVDEILPALIAALGRAPSAVLVAPPGAGKTTGVPLALRDAWPAAGKILLLSPRRIAARAAAARMAATLNEPVGRTVGLRVRLETKVSAATRIEVLTEGVFTRMILDDPTLTGVTCVIFDEFHERSLEADLGLALALDAQSGLREDLKLLVMSATLDGARVAALLGDAPVLESAGRMFPVGLRHFPRDPAARLEDATAEACVKALKAEAGSILVFLPGAREIERTQERLRDRVRDRDVAIFGLYGALDPADQDRAIAPAPAGKRKIVLASAIAETSLTIEGVRVVIDAGLSRRPKYDPASGLSRLETVRVSQAAASQRAGRAGRLEPGVCWRLWHEGETRALAPFDRPEILEAELSGLALDLAAWGVSDPNALRWLDPPPQAAWGEALALLKALGALDADGRLTAHGAKLSGFGLPPRLAHMLVMAAGRGRGMTAAALCVLLSETGLGGREIDARARLERVFTERGPRAEAARRLGASLARQAGAARDERPDPEAVGEILALAFPERIAMARPGRPGAFALAGGGEGALDPLDPLAREAFLVVAEAQGRAERAAITLAAPIPEAAIAERIVSEDRVAYDAGAGAVRARRVKRLGAIVLSEAPLPTPDPAACAQALLETVRASGLSVLPWEGRAAQWRARVALLARLEGAPWPDVSEAALLAGLLDWLGPALEGATRLDALDLVSALETLLPWDLRRRLEAEAPERFSSPAGGSALIDYLAEGGPAVSMRLQELFGLDRHPSIASGRIALTLLLLSPAQRPVQTTKDLPGFWRGSYAAVRADLRGRYPKHPWPEDPLAAEPTRRAKPRGE